MTTAALITLFVAVVIVMTALRPSKRKEIATTNRRPEQPPLKWWNISLGPWPGTRSLAEMMQSLGRDIHETKETLMAQGEELKTGMAALKAEVGEAVAKFNDIKAKLDAALADDADTAALKQAATEVSAEMGTITQHLDEAFGTQFTPSGN